MQSTKQSLNEQESIAETTQMRVRRHHRARPQDSMTDRKSKRK